MSEDMKEGKSEDIFSGKEFSSNAVRLTWREIIIAGLAVFAGLFFLLPWIWKKVEPIDFSPNFRIAEKFRDDYWAFSRWAGAACEKCPVIFLGDSVIWGMYTDNESSLPAKINAAAGQEIAANLAIDGLHSVALKGLLENYASGIKNKTVIVHFNPLWMNSPEYDLSGDKPARPHHPRLLPQFIGKPGAYDEDISARMDAVKEKSIPFFSLLNHIRMSRFANADFKEWLADNPYSNPAGEILKKVDFCERRKDSNSGVSWEKSGVQKQNWSWVPLEKSRQWAAFLDILDILKNNNNNVMALIGPINRHMMTDECRAKYDALRESILAELKKRGVHCLPAPDMPSELYADASHPLEKGYGLIAKSIQDSGFLDGVTGSSDRKVAGQ
jgi:hypothetical protein